MKKLLLAVTFALIITGCQNAATVETDPTDRQPPDETKGWEIYKNNEPDTEYYGLQFGFQYPNDYSESELFDWVQIESNDGLTDFSIHRSSKEKAWQESDKITDYSNPLNSELLSLSEYLRKYYELYYYKNSASKAYGNVDYQNIMQTDHFDYITSDNEDIQILREKLTQNLEGFESVAYLMDNKDRSVVMIFYWNFGNEDEELAKKELSDFDQILSTFTFIR